MRLSSYVGILCRRGSGPCSSSAGAEQWCSCRGRQAGTERATSRTVFHEMLVGHDACRCRTAADVDLSPDGMYDVLDEAPVQLPGLRSDLVRHSLQSIAGRRVWRPVIPRKRVVGPWRTFAGARRPSTGV